MKSRRESLGLSQMDLILKMYDHDKSVRVEATISNWERGTRFPPADDVARIANALGCNPEDLFIEEPVAPTPHEQSLD